MQLLKSAIRLVKNSMITYSKVLTTALSSISQVTDYFLFLLFKNRKDLEEYENIKVSPLTSINY